VPCLSCPFDEDWLPTSSRIVVPNHDDVTHALPQRFTPVSRRFAAFIHHPAEHGQPPSVRQRLVLLGVWRE